MSQYDLRKPTQGQVKMMRYVEDLVRNKEFRRFIKKMRQYRAKEPEGMYVDWTPEQQKEHDYINKEITSIINGYEILRKRCKKLFRNKFSIKREQIAEYYSLDNELINLAEVMVAKGNAQSLEWATDFADPDMCKIEDIRDDIMSPSNKGEEIIYLMPHKQLRHIAYPIGVVINPKASKRDVLDFIENRWKWIESLLRNYNQDETKGPIRMRKRKHDQKILDFIWEKRMIPSREIKRALDKQFPKNGLIYFEINKIKQLEKARRLRNLPTES